MKFITFDQVAEQLRGKRVAIVGSGPGCLRNPPGYIDGHDIVVRVNNYKNGHGQGFRTDVHYSFYGTSIRKSAQELQEDGVKLCMCKLPDSQPIESDWHRRNQKTLGIDYRYVYRNRASFWFCDTFIPDDERFLAKFNLLGKHQPTTGFAAILDVLECRPAAVYLTGFDFFRSAIHNVDEPWREKNTDDPIGHRPELEADWLRTNAQFYKMSFDRVLADSLGFV